MTAPLFQQAWTDSTELIVQAGDGGALGARDVNFPGANTVLERLRYLQQLVATLATEATHRKILAALTKPVQLPAKLLTARF